MLSRHLKPRGLALALTAGLLTMPALALAAPSYYHVHFTTLNNSGVTGNASLKLDNNMLTVHINATGLMADSPHPQHIHGAFDADGNNIQSTTPTLAGVDANSDGVIELGEGQTTYGPILIDLSSPPGGAIPDFPTAPGGTIDFTETYDLTNGGIYDAGYNEDSLSPLSFREIVIHGMNAPIALSDGGKSYMAGEYDPVLPVASGVIQTGVPEPSSIFDMLAGLGGILALVGLGRRRMRHAKTS